jgi:4-hydroxy-tetrahydrodipicolinate synthase
VVQACTAATSPKDCVELTRHAQEVGADESARIYDEIPAVCATKGGAFRPQNSRRLHELAPELVIWECDLTVYRAGWLRAGIVCPAQLGTVGYLHETPRHRILTSFWKHIYGDKLSEAIDYARTSGMDQFDLDMDSVFVCHPGRPECFTHWGGAFKHAAALLGLPIGDYPHSRAPQAEPSALPSSGSRPRIDASDCSKTDDSLVIREGHQGCRR